jgi:hypothetical protein
MPSVDHRVASAIWGIFFALFLWIGMLAIGISGATSFILGWVAGGAIFLFVLYYGGDDPARREAERRARV